MATIIVQPSVQPDVKTGVALVHSVGGNESWSAKLAEWGNITFSPPNGCAISFTTDHLFASLDPSSMYPIQIGRDDTMKRGAWSNPHFTNGHGFNLSVINKITSSSLGDNFHRGH